MSETLLVAERLAATLPDGRALFAPLTFSVGRERVALIGANGSGKSTLLRAIAERAGDGATADGTAPAPAPGIVHGTVRRHGTLWYVPQDIADRDLAQRTVADALGIAPRLAARARVLAGSLDAADHDLAADAWDLEARLGAACHAVGLPALDPARVVGALSGGEAMRLALAAALVHRPDILLLDEPTNHLDADGRDLVVALLRDWTGALVVATHDRALLGAVDRLVELTAHGLRHYGDPATFDTQRASERDAAARGLELARRERRAAQRAAGEARVARERREAHGAGRARTKGRSRIEVQGMRETASRSRARDDGAAEQRRDAADAAFAAARERVDEAPDLAPIIPHATIDRGTLLVRLERVRLAAGDRTLVDELDLAVHAGDRLHVAGANGSGKTTLLRVLGGATEPAAGTVKRALGRTAIAWLDQRVLADAPAGSVLEVAQRAHPDVPDGAIREWLAALALRADHWPRPAIALSGGERVRLAVARAVHPLHPPALLLADEPTNHLDLDAQRALGEALAAFGGALVVVTHDAALLGAIHRARDGANVSPVRVLTLAPAAPRADAAADATTARTRRPPRR